MMVEQLNIKIYRGDPIDVLQRLLDAANYFSIDNIICCGGDNPLVDVDYLEC